MLKITSLIENVSHKTELIAEHGLSLWIEKDDRRFLMDTGATGNFLKNAEAMGIKLDTLDGVIISHNHFDHIGGLEELFKRNRDAKVYIRSAARSRFFLKIGPLRKAIDAREGFFEDYADRFVFIDNSLDLAPDIHLMSNAIQDKAFFCQDRLLKEKTGRKYVPDEFLHELFLVMETEEGLVLVSSCSHNGIVNIIETISRRFPGKRILHVVAGLHMMALGNSNKLNCTEAYVRAVAARLDKTGVENLHVCHCTGFKACSLLQEALGDRVRYFETGHVLTV